MSIKSQLEVLPIEIREGRKFLIDISTMLEDVSVKIKKWEAAEMQAIVNEVMDNGKPTFSNAEKRQVELEQRRTSEVYIVHLDSDYKSIKDKMEQSRIELQYKIDVQENLRAIARLGGSEV
jgi:hypothetical protein